MHKYTNVADLINGGTLSNKSRLENVKMLFTDTNVDFVFSIHIVLNILHSIENYIFYLFSI